MEVQHVSELKELTEIYPYCTTTQLLYAKALSNTNDIKFDKQLKKTAVYTPNREALYKFILQPQIAKVIDEIESSVAEGKSTEKTLPTNEVSREESVTPETKEVKHPPVSDLEKEILIEAINASISLEIDEKIEQLEDENDFTEAAQEKAIEKPAKKEKDSFSGWLHGSSNSKRETFDNLIDKFIQTSSEEIAPKKEFFSPTNVAKMSLVDNNEFVTETLANIYLKQGSLEKARSAFEALRLKYPEKNSYFADRLKEIDELEK